MNSFKLWIPPSIRFSVELTTWIWLLFFNWYLLPLSIISLAILNFPGDKRPEGIKGPGIHVPGIIRIFVEIGSAVLGVYASYHLFGFLGLILQSMISLFSFILDFNRWLWMLGYREVPMYVTIVHKQQY